MLFGEKENVRRMAKLLIVILIGSFAGGCALGTRHVTLSYPPKSNTGKLNVADATATSLELGPEKTIAFFKFNDMRFDKSRIGHVQGGYGNDMADVVAENDVTEWINNAIIMELEDAGYKVVKGEKLDNTNNLPVLKGKILSVYVTAYLYYEAEVSLIAVLELDEKVITKVHYKSNGSVGSLKWSMTAESSGESLSLALADAVRQIVHDVNSQLFLMNNQ